MKHILLVILLFLAGLVNAQSPITQNLGSDSVTVKSKGPFWGYRGLVNGSFTDTTQANLYRIKDYPGAQVFTRNNNSVWLRDSSAKFWILQATNVNINTLVQNFNDSSVHQYQDSLLLICVGNGAERVCDTIHLGNSNTYFFASDSVLITCDTTETICVGDSCYYQQLCDTIPIPKVVSTQYQNGMGKYGHLVEFGAPYQGEGYGQLIHDTWLNTNYQQFTIWGRSYPRSPFVVRQTNWHTEGPRITTFNHIGSAYSGAVDYQNPVDLTISYATPYILNGYPIDTTGIMGPEGRGYYIGVNAPGSRYSVGYESLLSKQTGIVFHTMDKDNTDGVSIFAKHNADWFCFTCGPQASTTLADERVAVFKTSHGVQFPAYGDGSFTGVAKYIGAWDKDGNFIEYPPGGLTPGSGLLFARDDARNNSGSDAYFSNAVKDFVIDSTDYFGIGVKTTGGFDVYDYETGISRIRVNTGLGTRFLSPDGTTEFRIDNGSINASSFPSGTYILSDLRFEQDRGADVAAANDLTLGSDGNLFKITGSTQINALGALGWSDGSVIQLLFTGAPLVKHNTAGAGSAVPIILAGGTDFQAAPNDILTLTYDGTNWYETTRKLASSAGFTGITADNGLTATTATNVQWGATAAGANSPLLYNTFINTGGFLTTFTGSNAGYIAAFTNSGAGNGITSTSTGEAIRGTSTNSFGVVGLSTSGTGVAGLSLGNGAGVTAECRGTNIPLWVKSDVTAAIIADNAVKEVIEIQRLVSGGNGSSGIGAYINWAIDDNAGQANAAEQRVKWVDANHATRLAQMEFGVGNASGVNTIMSLYGTGVVGIGNSSGYTATRLEVLDPTTGYTTNKKATYFYNAGSTFDATGGNLTSFLGYFSNTSSRSAGANNLTNIGIYSTATGGQINYAGYFDGDVNIFGTNTAVSSLRVSNNSISTAAIVDISSTSTAAASNLQKGLNISLSGANVNGGETTYGGYISNAHGGSGTNYGLYVVAASGTSNIAVRGNAETYGVFGESSGGIGVRGTTVNGIAAGTFVANGSGGGMTASTQTGLAGQFDQSATAGTNDVTDLLEVRRQSSGTTAAGFGARIGYWLESDNGTITVAGGTTASWKVATHASRTSNVIVEAVNAASVVTSLTIGGEGFIQLRPISATAASAITAAEGMIVIVNTTDATFTSTGFWGYSGGAWAKF